MEKGEKKKEKGSWEKQLFEVRCEEKAKKKKKAHKQSVRALRDGVMICGTPNLTGAWQLSWKQRQAGREERKWRHTQKKKTGKRLFAPVQPLKWSTNLCVCVCVCVWLLHWPFLSSLLLEKKKKKQSIFNQALSVCLCGHVRKKKRLDNTRRKQKKKKR